MDGTKSDLSYEVGKNIKLWEKTTREIQIKETSPSKLPPLRVSPKQSPKQSPKNKFIRAGNYLTNVSRDKAEYKIRTSGTKKKYSGSLYEAFIKKETRPLEQKLSVAKKDPKCLWSKVAESDIVPCVPDIFLKIACTDYCAPYGARLDDQNYLVYISSITNVILIYCLIAES